MSFKKNKRKWKSVIIRIVYFCAIENMSHEKWVKVWVFPWFSPKSLISSVSCFFSNIILHMCESKFEQIEKFTHYENQINIKHYIWHAFLNAKKSIAKPLVFTLKWDMRRKVPKKILQKSLIARALNLRTRKMWKNENSLLCCNQKNKWMKNLKKISFFAVG